MGAHRKICKGGQPKTRPSWEKSFPHRENNSYNLIPHIEKKGPSTCTISFDIFQVGGRGRAPTNLPLRVHSLPDLSELPHGSLVDHAYDGHTHANSLAVGVEECEEPHQRQQHPTGRPPGHSSLLSIVS